MRPAETLTTLDAYNRWSKAYPPVPHNPLMRAEQKAMYADWPDVSGKRALDLGCGTGRYTQRLVGGGAAVVVALDLSDGMLRQVTAADRVQADMMQLPLGSGCLDVIISGLAVGHARSIHTWMTEIARVLRNGGVLRYSDFHPEASRAGLVRSFTDASGHKVIVPHAAYQVDEHRAAAAAAGLTIDTVWEVRAGRELMEEFPGSEEFYRRWQGLPLLLIVGAHK
jgi:ubiquinone/menaquinone biosynthesis C-methylase UbiE